MANESGKLPSQGAYNLVGVIRNGLYWHYKFLSKRRIGWLLLEGISGGGNIMNRDSRPDSVVIPGY